MHNSNFNTMKTPRSSGMGMSMSHGLGGLDRALDPIIVNLIMTPSPLLKFGSSGKPGFRMFQLSPDLLSLTWTSKNKAAAKTKVDIKDIKELRFGQRTDKFKRNNRPDLENLSFSAIYVDANGDLETLDLVCKDEAEFQAWTRTLSALHENKIDIRPYQGLVPSSPHQGTLKKKNQTMKALKDTKNAFKEANDVYAFGWGEWGQNGFGSSDYENATQPKLLEPLLGKHVVQVACGWSHTLVLLESGQPLAYGNRVGTGLNDDFFLPNPINIPDKHTVISIACGHFHSTALTDGGRLLTWGTNVYGQLGHGDRKDVKDPRPISTLAEVRAVSCGANFMAALVDDGRVFTWGSGEYGCLGHNTEEDNLAPKQVQDLVGTDIKRIACGDNHMFACTSRETYAWGWNGAGQLGLGHEEDQHRPHVVEMLRGSDVKDIAAGAAHSVAIVFVQKINVEIFYSWGLNSSGQCGQGKRARISKPSPLPEFKANELAEVQCGSFHTVLRCRNGEVYTCGSNKYGQLGLGTIQDCDELKYCDYLKDKSTRSIACGGENTAVLTARAWVEDSEAKECMACKAVFTFVNRKHHCRNCGGIFCGNCSNKKIAILKIQVTEPVRVCQNCYTMLGGR